MSGKSGSGVITEIAQTNSLRYELIAQTVSLWKETSTRAPL